VAGGPQTVRIDKWLFFARIAKSRSLAAKLVANGNVRVNGDKVVQASRHLRVGDTVTLTRDHRVQVLRLCATGTRRGPAPEARLLYDDLSPPPLEKPASALDAPAGRRDAGAGRPTKRERREIEKLRGER
jgi:ribosome-associated heat shock protein Hsp15